MTGLGIGTGRAWTALAAAGWLASSGCAARTPVLAEGLQVASRYQGKPLRIVPGTAVAASGRVHVVRPGDTLWGLSQRYGVSVADLSRRNGIADPTVLAVGTRLVIGGGSVRPSAPTRDPARLRPGSPKISPSGPSSVGSAEGSPAPGRAAPKDSGMARGPERGTPAKPKGPAESKTKAPAKVATGTKGVSSGSSKPTSAKPVSSSPAGAYRLRWPVEGGTVTSRFGKRGKRLHDGIDIGADRGTPVVAAEAGTVLFAGEHGSYGNLVVLKHDDGLVTVYAHNEQNLVRKGQRVRQGQRIGKVGQTGRATGPHLHFEVRRGTTPENPMRFLAP